MCLCVLYTCFVISFEFIFSRIERMCSGFYPHEAPSRSYLSTLLQVISGILASTTNMPAYGVAKPVLVILADNSLQANDPCGPIAGTEPTSTYSDRDLFCLTAFVLLNASCSISTERVFPPRIGARSAASPTFRSTKYNTDP